MTKQEYHPLDLLNTPENIGQIAVETLNAINQQSGLFFGHAFVPKAYLNGNIDSLREDIRYANWQAKHAGKENDYFHEKELEEIPEFSYYAIYDQREDPDDLYRGPSGPAAT